MVRWDVITRTYQLASNTLKPNAVRVTSRRTAARGNPIDLPFARLVGARTCDVNASAIALALPQREVRITRDETRRG